jgi:late competence protein required for DNA uptake (superfamily II DNA/RNA helicase)
MPDEILILYICNECGKEHYFEADSLPCGEEHCEYCEECQGVLVKTI